MLYELRSTRVGFCGPLSKRGRGTRGAWPQDWALESTASLFDPPTLHPLLFPLGLCRSLLVTQVDIEAVNEQGNHCLTGKMPSVRASSDPHSLTEC